MGSQRTGLIAVLGFGVGLATGLILQGVLVTPDARVVSRTDSPADPPGLTEPRARDSTTASSPAGESEPAYVPDGDGSPPLDPRTLHGAVAWFEVSIVDETGRPVRGQAYALPAGLGRADWDTIPCMDHYPPGPCLLPVGSAGTYDVGIRAEEFIATDMALDRKIDVGETVAVRIEVKKGKPITIVRDGAWPFQDELDSEVLRLSVGVREAGNEGRFFPGRGEVLNIHPKISMTPDGRWISTAVPTGLDLEVYALLNFDPGREEFKNERPAWRIEADPATVRAGGTVRLRVEPAAWIWMKYRLDSPEDWPVGGIEADFRLEQGGEVSEFGRFWRQRGYLKPQENSGRRHLVAARPGVVKLTWDGPGILPDSLDGLRLRQHEQTVAEIVLRIDPRELPVKEDIELTIHGLPARAASGGDVRVMLGAIVDPEDWENPTALDAEFWSEEQPPPWKLNWGWRRAPFLLACTDAGLVSRPAPIPRQGGVEIRLEPGGYLVVVPRTPIGTRMGEMRLRRSDGLPFYDLETYDGEMDGGYGIPRYSAKVFAGAILGPLPPGRHTFIPSIAGVDQPPAVVTVRPGRFEVLSIGR